jgi:hypothetical protein
MPASLLSAGQDLLHYLRPFRLGSGRLPTDGELKSIEVLVGDLQKRNPTPVLGAAFERVAGMWECVFTSSRFVLGLDHLPLVRVSAVYQNVTVHPDGKMGHYFNIAELSRGAAVRYVCGEYAKIRPSDSHPARMDVQYEWFYVGWRVSSPYEGHRAAADELEEGRLSRAFRLPFRACGWQSTVYLDDRLRVVNGSKGGLFVLVKCSAGPSVRTARFSDTTGNVAGP